jgi:hypothetical protein
MFESIAYSRLIESDEKIEAGLAAVGTVPGAKGKSGCPRRLEIMGLGCGCAKGGDVVGALIMG